MLRPHINHFVNQAAERSPGEITPGTLKAGVERGDTRLRVILDRKREGPARFRAIVGAQPGRVMSGMKLCTIIFCAGKGLQHGFTCRTGRLSRPEAKAA